LPQAALALSALADRNTRRFIELRDEEFRQWVAELARRIDENFAYFEDRVGDMRSDVEARFAQRETERRNLPFPKSLHNAG
jgi:hypothetical protein